MEFVNLVINLNLERIKMNKIERIKQLEKAIYQLYVKEGRSLNYIQNLLELDKQELKKFIEENNWVQENQRYLKPSEKKFLGNSRTYIKSRLDINEPIDIIVKDMKINKSYLLEIIKKDEVLNQAYKEYKNRNLQKEYIELSTDLTNEEWKPILGYNYLASNKGRIKSLETDEIIKPFKNYSNQQVYIRINNKNLKLARIIAHCFCEGFSVEQNQVNHKDGNTLNNKAENLEWVGKK